MRCLFFLGIAGRRISSAFRAIVLPVEHPAGRPLMPALFADMRPFHRSRAIDALHQVLVGRKCPLSGLCAADTAVFVLRCHILMTVPALIFLIFRYPLGILFPRNNCRIRPGNRFSACSWHICPLDCRVLFSLSFRPYPFISLSKNAPHINP